MRIVKIASLVSALITVVGLTLLVLNYFDEPERPEVAAILKLNTTASEAQQAAFFYVLGLHADPTRVPQAAADPEAAGRELWREFNTLPQTERPSFWQAHIAQKPVWPQNPITCPDAPLTLCTTSYLKTHPFVGEFLKRDPETLKKYTRLMEYGAGVNLFYGDDQILFSRLWVISPGHHRQFLLQLARWSVVGETRRALHELDLSSHYLHDILSNGNLFERMVAAQQLALNAAFLKAELEIHPKAKVPGSLIEVLSAPPADEILTGALKREVQFAAHLMANIGARPLVYWFRPLAFRPTDTLNQFYELNLKELQTSQTQEIKASNFWDWLINPFGRRLLNKFALHLSQRKRNLEASLKHLSQDQLEISKRH